MIKQLLNKYRHRRAVEHGAIIHPWDQGRFRVALVYPNSYSNGMSNLGFQTVYQMMNQREDCLCERFFLPDKEDLDRCRKDGGLLLSLESERKITDFDLIALSISFENDYLNLPVFFELAGLPLFTRERRDTYPPVLFGGVCAFLNPEPLADIVDLVAVGEAEELLPGLLDQLTGFVGSREELLYSLLNLPGIYLPCFYRPQFNPAGEFSGFEISDGAPESVRRQYASVLDRTESRNFIKTPESDFGSMALTEVSRGCSRGCRFCAAGYIYLPPREHSIANLKKQIDTGLDGVDRVGLVASAVADYSEIDRLQKHVLSAGAKISISSLRLDALTAGEVENLRKADHRTVAIAPEAGSQKMRDFINKGINEEQILNAVQLLADGDILNLKLYYIIGLPSEDREDVEAILNLSKKIGDIWRQAGRRRGALGSVTLSINPFVPKPFTPLQWEAMESEKGLKKKYRFLQSNVARMANMRINCESIRHARMQAFLSRGDRRVGSMLPELAEGQNLRQACRSYGLNADLFITSSYPEQASFAWDIIDQGIDKGYLWRENQRAWRGQLTAPCTPGCQRCGVCIE